MYFLCNVIEIYRVKIYVILLLMFMYFWKIKENKLYLKIEEELFR